MSSKHVWWRPLSWWRFLKPCVQAVVLLDSWQVQDQEVPGGSVWAPYSLEPTNVWDPASKRSWNPDQATWTWQKGPTKGEDLGRRLRGLVDTICGWIEITVLVLSLPLCFVRSSFVESPQCIENWWIFAVLLRWPVKGWIFEIFSEKKTQVLQDFIGFAGSGIWRRNFSFCSSIDSWNEIPLYFEYLLPILPSQIAVLSRAWRMDFGLPSPRKIPSQRHLVVSWHLEQWRKKQMYRICATRHWNGRTCSKMIRCPWRGVSLFYHRFMVGYTHF